MRKTKNKRQQDTASQDVASLVKENIDGVEAYIKQHLPVLAKLGWEGHKERGKGYVYLGNRAGHLCYTRSNRKRPLCLSAVGRFCVYSIVGDVYVYHHIARAPGKV